MSVMLPMMFESFDRQIGYPSFIPLPSSVPMKMDTSPKVIATPDDAKKSPVAVTDSPYTILPWRPFGTNPLGWAVSNVLLKGAEALLDLQEPEMTAY